MRERILAIDPGAERLGWAVIDRQDGGVPKVHASGILGLERRLQKNGHAKDEEYQKYKLRLIDYWVVKAPALLRDYGITKVVAETLPAVGGGSFIAATQSELAKTAITVIFAFAMKSLCTVIQIGATTVKTAIGGTKDATKARVRNGVIYFLPDFGPELKKETTGDKPVWDRSDAIAIGLAYYGLKIK